METILFVIAIVAIIIESLVLANTKRKLKAETTEANRLRTEMLRFKNRVDILEQEVEILNDEIKDLQKQLENK